MFRASSCPSSGAYQLQQQPLVYRRNVVVAVLLAVVGPVVFGLSSFSLHILLNQIAAIVLCSFRLTFLYEYISLAFLTFINLGFCMSVHLHTFK